MKEFSIGQNDAGQRLDRFVGKAVPLLPASLTQKYIRLKRIKVNSKGAKRDYKLAIGDTVQMYVNDEFFEKPSESNAFLKIAVPEVDVVYEDRTAAGPTTPSLHRSRPTCMPRENTVPGPKTPLPPPCATGSTGTPPGSSSPPRTRRPCGS